MVAKINILLLFYNSAFLKTKIGALDQEAKKAFPWVYLPDLKTAFNSPS